MDFEALKSQLLEGIQSDNFIGATFSQPRAKADEVKRVKAKRVMLRDEVHIQFEYQFERVLEHENVSQDNVAAVLFSLLERFRQLHVQFTDESVHIQISKKYKVMWKAKQEAQTREVDLSHDRKKQYLLDDGVVHPFLVRLGVQSEDGKVRKKHYDKFRQINRFLEFIDDTLVHLPKDRQIRILDFGSGKSYLTFALYHYLHHVKGLDIRVTGLDLKKEVIEHCQEIADDLAYEQLEFLVGDINDYEGDSSADMVVTLHACDTATDMALGRAVRWGASVILSVPCCQHELFRQLEANHLDVMIQHGLVKERFAALATDSMRAELLGLVGYDVQLLEFIDMEHTPKNILIRAYKTGRPATTNAKDKYVHFRDMLGAKPYLEKELTKQLDLSEHSLFS